MVENSVRRPDVTEGKATMTPDKSGLTDHPCNGCEAKAIDHAVICPLYGVISSGRCKRIQRKDAGDALQGITRNRRVSIQLRSGYFQSDSFHTIYKGISYKDRAIHLIERRKAQGELSESIGRPAMLRSFGPGLETAKENGESAQPRPLEAGEIHVALQPRVLATPPKSCSRF